MLKGRSYEYFIRLGAIKISGLPPEGWEELSTEDQFKEIKSLLGFDAFIKSVQFDY